MINEAQTLLTYAFNYIIHLYRYRYAIIYSKGYQKFDDGLSSVTTKVKGIAYTNLSIDYPVTNQGKTVHGSLDQGPRTWDSADYIHPAEVGLLRDLFYSEYFQSS